MIDEKKVMDALREVYDPEIGMDIVTLGLIYDVQINGNDVYVKMTLTTPRCPLAQPLRGEAEERLKKIEGIGNVKVELVWDPPWTPEMMSEEGRKKFGIKV